MSLAINVCGDCETADHALCTDCIDNDRIAVCIDCCTTNHL